MRGVMSEAMSDIANQIWDMKYRLKQPDGTPVDADFAATWASVALAAAQAEPAETRAHHALEFAWALTGHRFLPTNHNQTNTDTNRSVTRFNCFVMGTITD